MQAVGTTAYFSPEKWMERPDCDRSAIDCWALGVTLHMAAFGCFPNMTDRGLPILMTDYVAPEGTNPNLATILQSLMKVCASCAVRAVTMHPMRLARPCPMQYHIPVHLTKILPEQVDFRERWTAQQLLNYLDYL